MKTTNTKSTTETAITLSNLMNGILPVRRNPKDLLPKLINMDAPAFVAAELISGAANLVIPTEIVMNRLSDGTFARPCYVSDGKAVNGQKNAMKFMALKNEAPDWVNIPGDSKVASYRVLCAIGDDANEKIGKKHAAEAGWLVEITFAAGGEVLVAAISNANLQLLMVPRASADVAVLFNPLNHKMVLAPVDSEVYKNAQIFTGLLKGKNKINCGDVQVGDIVVLKNGRIMVAIVRKEDANEKVERLALIDASYIFKAPFNPLASRTDMKLVKTQDTKGRVTNLSGAVLRISGNKAYAPATWAERMLRAYDLGTHEALEVTETFWNAMVCTQGVSQVGMHVRMAKCPAKFIGKENPGLGFIKMMHAGYNADGDAIFTVSVYGDDLNGNGTRDKVTLEETYTAAELYAWCPTVYIERLDGKIAGVYTGMLRHEVGGAHSQEVTHLWALMHNRVFVKK